MRMTSTRFVAAGFGAIVALLVAPIPVASARTSSTPVGNDVSYPQCGGRLPSGQAFGIVGVNDGLANNLNPCLGPSAAYPGYRQSELYWAQATSSGVLHQARAQLYVNTADPGNWYNDQPIADWPTSGTTPYGTCTRTTMTDSAGTSYTVGQDSTACAYQYGEDRVRQDLSDVGGAVSSINGQETSTPMPGATTYPYWLDVETANSWLSGSSGTAMNVADLQGMVDAFHGAGVSSVGIYSTSSAWQQITGGSAAGSLGGLNDWVPGAANLAGAQSNCRQASFTGGALSLTQWTAKYDDDYSCFG